MNIFGVNVSLKPMDDGSLAAMVEAMPPPVRPTHDSACRVAFLCVRGAGFASWVRAGRG